MANITHNGGIGDQKSFLEKEAWAKRWHETLMVSCGDHETVAQGERGANV